MSEYIVSTRDGEITFAPANTVQEVIQNVITALASNQMIAPSYWVDPKSGNDYLLTVQYPENYIKSFEDLMAIPLHGPNKAQTTRLDAVSKMRQMYAPTEVNHYQLRRVIDIYVTPSGEDLGRLVEVVEPGHVAQRRERVVIHAQRQQRAAIARQAIPQLRVVTQEVVAAPAPPGPLVHDAGGHVHPQPGLLRQVAERAGQQRQHHEQLCRDARALGGRETAPVATLRAQRHDGLGRFHVGQRRHDLAPEAVPHGQERDAGVHSPQRPHRCRSV